LHYPFWKNNEIVYQAFNFKTLKQACQTQTTLRAEKATKNAEGVAKVQDFLRGLHLAKFRG